MNFLFWGGFSSCGPSLRDKALRNWAAANGAVTNGGIRGVWPPFLEISRNRPFSPFFCLSVSGGPNSTWEIQKTEEKGLFPQISSDFLKPPSLKPPFAALLRYDLAWLHLQSLAVKKDFFLSKFWAVKKLLIKFVEKCR